MNETIILKNKLNSDPTLQDILALLRFKDNLSINFDEVADESEFGYIDIFADGYRFCIEEFHPEAKIFSVTHIEKYTDSDTGLVDYNEGKSNSVALPVEVFGVIGAMVTELQLRGLMEAEAERNI